MSKDRPTTGEEVFAVVNNVRHSHVACAGLGFIGWSATRATSCLNLDTDGCLLYSPPLIRSFFLKKEIP
jgi:hypothetical protein